MADNVTTQTSTLATVPTSTVIETRDQGSGVERQVVQTQTGLRVSASFTRPADTTAYSSGDLVANSTTAGSVTPMSFVLGNASAVTVSKSTFNITRGKIKKSGTVSTSSSMTLYLFGTDPSASSGIINGDNAAFLVNDAAYLGQLVFGNMSAFNDCCMTMTTVQSAGAAPGGGIVVTSSNATVYGLLAAGASYTPGSSEVFTITLEGVQN